MLLNRGLVVHGRQIFAPLPSPLRTYDPVGHGEDSKRLPVPNTLNAIRTLRLAKAWRQRDLAVLLGVTQTDVSAYESGRVIPTLPRALDISNALGRRIEEVFFELFEVSCAAVGERGARMDAAS